ncbi:Crp/Fnr family transcriptional regulator [Marivirga sp. S37H4]|uniref:Crp/Fnr family transcriptional regulator n=1 Tax=Marivirga aurantiaca TaxID=2802615 RepID=A0A934X0E2_9BACT|nr:Crp/Fnr family transcriptional regulator [Marivirga aurantiaca]MBK6266579.1 Crp/Fnr family transcriptional regulator [Marivirga aurantiaca]
MRFLEKEKYHSQLFPSENRGVMFKPFKTFLKNQIIYQQGEPADQLFLIKSGAVKLSKINDNGDELLCYYLTTGDVLGEWNSLIDPSCEYQYHAMAIEPDTSLESLNVNYLNEQTRNNAFLSLSSVFMERIRFMEKRHYLLAMHSADYRVRETLRMMAKESGVKVGDEILLKISMSHQELALLSDTSRQTVTTVLNKMRAQGKIYYTRDRILFRDLDNIHHY